MSVATRRIRTCFPTYSKNRLPKAIPLNYQVGHENVSFFCPIFSGAHRSEGFCFQSERLLYGREPNGVRDGTGKAEGAKLLDAGISLKQCPGK
jgi:hypothetical protein